MRFRIGIFVTFNDDDKKAAMRMAQGQREMDVLLYILKAFGFTLDDYTSTNEHVTAELTKDMN